jgi:hypothetical protein
MTKYIVTRLKDCPHRGEVRVIESTPLPLAQAHAAMEAVQDEHPGAQLLCEMLTDAELAEWESTCEYEDDECFGTVAHHRCHRHADEGAGYGQITQRMIDEAGRFQL